MVDKQVLQQVRAWGNELLNLTRSNNLLYFKPLKVATLEVLSPDPASILDHFYNAKDNSWFFEINDAENKSDDLDIKDLSSKPQDSVESISLDPQPSMSNSVDTISGKAELKKSLLTSKTKLVDLEASLKNLFRASSQDFLDKGLWTLYIGMGFLHWIDPDTKLLVDSPLVLVPVRLKRVSKHMPFELVKEEGEAVFNPALRLTLENSFGMEFSQVLQTLGDIDTGSNLETVFDQVKAVISTQFNWKLSKEVVLARFSFHKEVIYQDLRQNQQLIMQHPLIQAMSLGLSHENAVDLGFDPLPEDQLDTKAPPEVYTTVLDADASQRQCIEAASRGKSFIIDGPPGTGKSQTIANIIAELIKAGRSVLFVSEKAAALDVVANRLDSVGLGDYVLNLYNQKMPRSQVSKQLSESIKRTYEEKTTLGAIELSNLQHRRKELSSYAIALNEIRHPFDRSLYDVIGRSIQLDKIAQCLPPSCIDLDLSAEDFSLILDLARRISRSWKPVESGSKFLWRKLVGADFDSTIKKRLQSQLDQAQSSLDKLKKIVEVSCFSFGFESKDIDAVGELKQLSALLEQPHQISPLWLNALELDSYRDRIDQLHQLSQQFLSFVSEIENYIGKNWQKITLEEVKLFNQDIDSLAKLDPPITAQAFNTRTDFINFQQFCQTSSVIVPQMIPIGESLSKAFGSKQQGLSLEVCEKLAIFGRLSKSENIPLTNWLDSSVLSRVEQAYEILNNLITRYWIQYETLKDVFEDSVLTLDLEGLCLRFETLYQGIGKMRGSYRDDKKTIVSHLRSRHFSSEVVPKLKEAKNLQETYHQFQKAAKEYGPLLGSYYNDLETDFSKVKEAIDIAKQVIESAGHNFDKEQLSFSLSKPSLELWDNADELQKLVSQWQEAALLINAELSMGLKKLWFMHLLAWQQQSVKAIESISKAFTKFEEITKTPLSLEKLKKALVDLEAIEQIRNAIDSDIDSDLSMLGSSYKGLDTNWELFISSFELAKQLRALLGGPISEKQSIYLLNSNISSAEIDNCLKKWELAKDEFLANFEMPYRHVISKVISSSFCQSANLLTQFEQTIDDVAQWFSFEKARKDLDALGFGEQINFCIQQKISSDQVPLVLERAILEYWTDLQISNDERLQILRAPDREAIRKEFIDLDKQLFAYGSSQVIKACNQRRPSVGDRRLGSILKEAEKKRKHKPIRDFFEENEQVVKALKPCFMMIPVTVSQFLKSNFCFDTVIFDESSQVRPSDAINAIYRGSQLIIAGDQKQLPPTSFFDSLGQDDESDQYQPDEVEEFQSVLDLCQSGVLVTIGLRWHYRSRHESLITYSNRAFYLNRFLTFPSAHLQGDDKGLELIKVDGTYARGGRRDNIVEAEKVVERVLYHLRNNPNSSIGVIAFSQAQSDAINAAFERSRKKYMELDDLFDQNYSDENRLEGFFIKNLENVQGDERDIIIFSIGYGPDEVGKLSMNFGPLNKAGGERRLNVAITRARTRVEIISSITANDFKTQPNSGGLFHLQHYLDFAQRGVIALSGDTKGSLHGFESPFEEQVASLIQSWGYEIVPQVGQASYRIDLGVRDPKKPGRFLLGIECDGAMYHSSKVARDRDRLRNEILQGLGWNLYHIWGTSWYRERRQAELDLKQAIKSAEEAL